MKNNHGFSNILVVSIILVLLGIGSFLTYNYLQKPNVEEPSNDIVVDLTQDNLNEENKAEKKIVELEFKGLAEQITQPENRVFVSFNEKESGRKCSDVGTFDYSSSYYEIELNENNQKRVIARPLDEAYLLNNQIYYTYEDPSNKTFLVYKIDSNLKPVKLKEYKFDGINYVSKKLIGENLVFILNTDQLYKLNLKTLSDRNVKLDQPFSHSYQEKDKEFVLQESIKKSNCNDAYGGIPQVYQIREIENLSVTKTLKNVPTSIEDQNYLELYKYVDNSIKMDQMLIFDNQLFK